ncbi:MAG: hypothetical protein SFX73_14770 [Kofleriaceae bacterium]|nr:hypothetical protein [Kofleriaceae bacterium]
MRVGTAMRVLLALSLLLASTAVAAADDNCSEAPSHTLPLEPLELMENTSCLRRGTDWVIAARGRDDVNHGSRIITIVVDRKGRRLATARTRSSDDFYSLELKRTLDVDGDGTLELLAEEREGDNFRVVILGVRGSDVLRLLAVPYQPTACKTPYAIADNRLELRCGTPRSYAWNGMAMREVGVEPTHEQHDPSCPPLTRIAKLMRIKPGETIGTSRCGAGRFPRLATVVLAGREKPYDGSVEPRKRNIFILDGERVIARHAAAEYADITGEETHELVTTGDLDGDGIDELMLEKRLDTPMGHESTLVVYAVRAGGLKKLSEQPFRSQSEPGFIARGEHDAPRFAPENTLSCDAATTLRPHGPKRRGADLVVTRTIRAGAKVPKDRIPAGYCTSDEKR